MAALRSRCGHYIFALWFLSIFLSLFIYYCAKFGGPPVSDVAAVICQDAKPVDICWGAPNPPTNLSRWWAEVHHIVVSCGGDIAV